MQQPTPLTRNLAKGIIAFEAGEKKSSDTQTPAAFRGCEKLRLHLAAFMGNTGFHTLLSRALVLATAKVPWLRGVRVNADGALEGLEELQSQFDRDELFDGGVVLLTQLIGLLVAFIGEPLTLCLVREVWPKVPLKDLNFSNGGKK